MSLAVTTLCGDAATRTLAVEVLPAEQSSSAQSASTRSSAASSSSTSSACVPAAVPVRIESFVPNPVGDDAAEVIVLGNPSDAEIDLCGWRLDDEEGGSSPFSLDGLRIPANGTLPLPRATTGIALNNDGDTVRLLPPPGIGAGEEVAYGKASEGKVFARRADGSFGPGEPADIPPDASVAAHPATVREARVLRVLEGGKVIVRFAGAGRATIALPSAAIAGAADETLRALLRGAVLGLAYAAEDDPLEEPSAVFVGGVPLADLLAGGPAEGFSLAGDVRIVEVYASPDPAATRVLAGEWIELWNAGDADARLDGWLLDDDPATGTPWAIPSGTFLPAGSRLVLVASGIRLNNSGDQVLLIDPSGAVRDSVTVPALKASMSYSRLEGGEWCVTTLPTPGEANACVRAAVSSRKASSSARKVAKPKSAAKVALVVKSSATASSSPAASAVLARLQADGSMSEPDARWGEYLVWAVAVSLAALSMFLLLVGRKNGAAS